MKRLLAGLLMLALFAQGCVSETQYGDCQGVATEQNKKPDLVYRANIWNFVLGCIFIETVIVPIYVIGWAMECPTGKK